jgi:hypothetical protein
VSEEAADDAPRWGLVIVALALGAIAAWGVLALQPGAPAPAPAVRAADDVATLAAAAAAAPDSVAAALALAHRHFDDSAYDRALAGYLDVLEQQPGNARALARSGWIAWEGGDDVLAEDLLVRSLDAAPDDPEALWFLAQVRLHGRADGPGAVAALDRLAAREDLTDGFRAQVDKLRDEAAGS